MQNFVWISIPCQNLEKTKNTIPRKHQTTGRKHGLTLFHRTLPTSAWSPIKHSWHFNQKKKNQLTKLTDNNNNESEDVGDTLFADVLQNRCSQNFHKIHRKTPMLELLFQYSYTLEACNLVVFL